MVDLRHKGGKSAYYKHTDIYLRATSGKLNHMVLDPLNTDNCIDLDRSTG